MLHHVSVSVLDYKTSKEFYENTLKALGIDLVMEFDHSVAGFGYEKQPFFWISSLGNTDEDIGKARGLHIAFNAKSRKMVDEWFAAAIKHGAKDNGKPGIRAQYSNDYYAAYVIDPNGWRIEAVHIGE